MPERNGDDPGSSSATGTTPSRRQFLKLAGGGTVGAGAARVAYELLGYGTVTGTNLTDQRLGRIARRRLEPSPFRLTLSSDRLAFDGDSVAVATDAGDPVGSVPVVGPEPTNPGRLDIGADAAKALDELAADLRSLAAGELSVDPSGYEAFFDRLRDARHRPLTVAALRGDRVRQPPPGAVRRLTGADPSSPAALVPGLAEGFRSNTHFDVSRYVAGTVQEHLLHDAVPLRARFEDSTGFDAILDGSTGMYCYEYALRSVEAFHAVAPHRQSTPVFAGFVFDRRHNHVFTALASAVREQGTLRIPMTFLDYSHSTMYHNYRLRWALGAGIDAYDERHRASHIQYSNPYSR